MSSACIKWAKEHLDGFNAILARQLSSVQRGTGVWDKCMDIVHEQAAQLTEVGVDFRGLIGGGLETNGTATSGGAAAPAEPGAGDGAEAGVEAKE